MFEQDRNSYEIEYPDTLKNKYYLSGISAHLGISSSKAQHFISRGAKGDSENLTAIIKNKKKVKKKKFIHKIHCGLQCVRDSVRDGVTSIYAKPDTKYGVVAYKNESHVLFFEVQLS